MTKEEAWKIIDACKDWDIGQIPTQGSREERIIQTDLLNIKRLALGKAWYVVGEC